MLELGMRQEPCWAQFLSKPEEGHLLGTKTRPCLFPAIAVNFSVRAGEWTHLLNAAVASHWHPGELRQGHAGSSTPPNFRPGLQQGSCKNPQTWLPSWPPN